MRLRVLDVREGEWKAAGPALALAALALSALTLVTIASDALFVSTFEVGRLAGFYVITAAGRVAAALAYGAYERRATGDARPVAGLVVLTASLALASGVVSSFAPPPLLYLICVALQTVPLLLPLVAMNAAVASFESRQVKRLLPLVAAAGTLGAVFASAVARLLAVATGTGVLLFLAAALALAALVPARLAAPSAPRAARDTNVPTPDGVLATITSGIRDFGEVPIARIGILTAFFVAATMSLADFGFKAALKERFGLEEMAASLGSFGMIAGGLVLAAQLFATGRVLSRFGVGAALLCHPAALLLFSPLVLFSGVGAAAAVKLADMVPRVALVGPVSELLLVPTPAAVRARRELFARAVATPLGVVAAAVVLVPFGSIGPTRTFLALMLAVAAGASLASLVRSRAAYAGALAEAIGQGNASLHVSPEAADLVRAELASVLAVAVASGDARRTAHLLSLMADRSFTLEDIAPALVAGGTVGQAAVQAAARLARPGDGPALLAMVPPGEDLEVERGVLALARALGAPAERARLESAYARSKDRADAAAAGLWAEAITGLARFEPDTAMRELHAAAQGSDSPRRAVAIRALGVLGWAGGS